MGRPSEAGQGLRRRRRGTFRDEVVDLHRRIFRRNRRLINSSVSGYSAAFRRYEREYEIGVERYLRRASLQHLDRALARADVAYVGDYHTLTQAQRGFVRILRRIDPRRPITVALEFVEGRHQRHLDAFMSGELTEEGFLRAISHRRHWGFDAWGSFKRIFDHCRERGVPIVGIDRQSAGPAGQTVRARDRYAAAKIAAIRETRPDDLVMVLIGELHIAPEHLPACVEDAVPGRSVVVYQNCEEIYWNLEAKGLEHTTELVLVERDRYCLINTPPVVCQQSFLNRLSSDEGLDAPEKQFRSFAKEIADTFDLPIGDALATVEVSTVMDLRLLQKLQKRGDFTARDLRAVREQILRSESYYMPRAKMVYLGTLSVNHASEEATHFLRDVCSRPDEPRLLVDAFYARALEEAVGFLGSKLINHKRKSTRDSELRAIARSRRASPLDRRVAQLVLRHGRLEQGQRVRRASEIYECDADAFNGVTHCVGYQLGERIYYGLVSGAFEKSMVRQLFFDPWSDEGAATTTYFRWALMTSAVELPERI